MKYSKDGYKRTSKDKNNPYNVIPSGNITMEGVDFPVFGMDNLGNSRVMMPGANYIFPGSSVFEVPMQKGGSVSWQWKGKTYSGTLIPSMETATNRYARTKNGKIKTLPKGQDGKEVKDYYRGYLNSPLFKRRAINLYGEENWESVRDAKLERLENTEVDFSGGEEWLEIHNQENPTLRDIMYASRRIPELQSRYMRPNYKGEGNENPIIKVNPGQAITQQQDLNLSYDPFNSIVANEYSHALGATTGSLDPFPYPMTEEEIRLSEKRRLSAPYDSHDSNFWEMKSDIDTTRYELWKAGLYNFEEDFMFDQSHIDYIRNNPDKFIKDVNLFKQYDDDVIIDQMNIYTDNSSMPLQMAKQGGLLPKAQDGSMFDLKGYFRGEQGLIPDLYGKTTKQTYKENKDNVQKGLDVVSATGIPFVSQAANLGSSAIDFGDAYSAYKSGDMDTYNQELAKATTNVTLGMVPGVKQAKLIKNVAQGVGENIVKTGINTATKYGAKSGIKSGVDEAVDAISGKAMFGGEVYRYERSPFKNGKFVISNPADLIIEITKTEVFTPEFKMGGSVKMNEFNLEKKFDKDKKLPYIEYTGEPDIEGRVYYDDETNEIVDVTTLELRKQRKHDRIKMIIDKYESDIELSSTEKEALNSLGLLD